jgi:hypothetical protein
VHSAAQNQGLTEGWLTARIRADWLMDRLEAMIATGAIASGGDEVARLAASFRELRTEIAGFAWNEAAQDLCEERAEQRGYERGRAQAAAAAAERLPHPRHAVDRVRPAWLRSISGATPSVLAICVLGVLGVAKRAFAAMKHHVIWTAVASVTAVAGSSVLVTNYSPPPAAARTAPAETILGQSADPPAVLIPTLAPSASSAPQPDAATSKPRPPKPSPSPSPSSSPASPSAEAQPAGTLTASTTSLHLRRSQSATIVIDADQGPVNWTATTSSEAIQLSAYSGALAVGQALTLTVSVTGSLAEAGARTGYVWLQPGLTIQVSWGAPRDSWRPTPPSTYSWRRGDTTASFIPPRHPLATTSPGGTISRSPKNPAISSREWL